MDVDKTGHHGFARDVNYERILGNLRRTAGAQTQDAIAGNDDGAVFNDVAVMHREYSTAGQRNETVGHVQACLETDVRARRRRTR